MDAKQENISSDTPVYSECDSGKGIIDDDHSNQVDDGHGSEQHNSVLQCDGLDQETTTVENVNASKSEPMNTAQELIEPVQRCHEEEVDYLHDDSWCYQTNHVFVLSNAGKPIFSLHGDEDKLATLFGVIQALVSFVQTGQDAITSINAKGVRFVFLEKDNLIFVAVSRSNMSITQLRMQLNDVYYQILSTLTYTHVARTFEKRKNFDLRRLLAGSERLIQHLLSINSRDGVKWNYNFFNFLTNSIRILPLQTSMRTTITNVIKENCHKMNNLVFAILIVQNTLIALVRMKQYSMHAGDLRLIFNLVECSESFKTSENWTPICLPRFDMNGYLYAHVSYLTESCQACLLLLSVDKDDFFILSEAKKRVTEKLMRSNCLEAINEATMKNLNFLSNDTSGLRHFLYKPRSIAQLLCPKLLPPYNTTEYFQHLQAVYCCLFERIHNTATPLKLYFQSNNREVVLAWMTKSYELYAVFEPLMDKNSVIKSVDKLIKSIEKEYDNFFIRIHPTF